ncbi:MAG: DNA polymerase III subunit delta [Chloroflexi bacterium]|nr:DNA polymerase III subunit delta [Chloroflexota bacterium]MCL5025808.1 DNA polymerase III subunit delta [Chloroflexota bacterium]
MIYLLLEDPRGAERLARIRAGLGDPSLRESNTSTLDGQRTTPAEVRNACLAFPFLAPSRLVVVRGLLARFQPKERPKGGGRPGRSNGEKAKGLEQEFAAALREVPEHTDLVLLEAAPWREQGLLVKALQELKAEVLRPLRPDELPAWIRQRVEAKGGRISPQAAGRLAGMIGDDLQSLDGELDKLVTFAGEGAITWDDVQLLVSAAQEANIFALVDRVAEGNARGALQELHRLLADGMALPQIMTMVSRQFRLLLLWRELRSAGVQEYAARQQLRLADFVAQKVSRQAARYSLEQLEELYRRLVEIDLRWKTGQADPLVALEVFISEVALGSRRRQVSQNRRTSATTLP